jgi:hypothetical protein
MSALSLGGWLWPPGRMWRDFEIFIEGNRAVSYSCSTNNKQRMQVASARASSEVIRFVRGLAYNVALVLQSSSTFLRLGADGHCIEHPYDDMLAALETTPL